MVVPGTMPATTRADWTKIQFLLYFCILCFLPGLVSLYGELGQTESRPAPLTLESPTNIPLYIASLAPWSSTVNISGVQQLTSQGWHFCFIFLIILIFIIKDDISQTVGRENRNEKTRLYFLKLITNYNINKITMSFFYVHKQRSLL